MMLSRGPFLPVLSFRVLIRAWFCSYRGVVEGVCRRWVFTLSSQLVALVGHPIDFVDFAAELHEDVVDFLLEGPVLAVGAIAGVASFLGEVEQAGAVSAVQEVDRCGWHHQVEISIATFVLLKDHIVATIPILVMHDGLGAIRA